MKAKINKVYIIALGVVVALCLTASIADSSSIENGSQAENADLLSKYKSSVPLVTAPLQILAKGLNIINKESN